ncbi:rhamnose-binding lectin-like [Saccoglossus kowalevskii]|uniref:L-rhamnose-binding lectin CSL1-like n=1 Tax=Saccoglossus kowalevskii TaxID=10224 RepID=A0ABM0GIJ2_SACKO|nr:PREDICTED: L-rhamnose-binding lectin CSL1-like [Saccoglossus kowalevskii]
MFVSAMCVLPYFSLLVTGLFAVKTVGVVTITCYNDSPMVLDCSDKIIHINTANYGRTDGASTCPHTHVSDTDCHSPTSLSVVQTYCEGRSFCSVPLEGATFGPDPCHGTYKYLEVDYECVTPIPDVVEVGCFNTNTDDDPIESLECRDDHLVSHHLERENHVEKCAQAAAARGWTTFSLLDGGACHSDADACQNQDNFGETTDCGETGTSTKHVVYEIIQREIVCQDEVLHLECDCGFIHIVSANFGRSDPYTCGGPVLTTDCSSASSFSIVHEACERKTSCDIHAIHTLFGDPCVGTFKYLDVEYYCNQIPGELEQPSSAITCYYDSPMELSCIDLSIHILSANYGRTDGASTCPHTHVSDTDCHSPTSLSVVQNYCEGRSFCSVPLQGATFGPDPCYGIYKYLEVDYECVAAVLPFTVITCYNDSPMQLDCFDKSIHIVSANYGRTDGASTCPHAAVSDTDCHSPTSLSVVQSACEGNNACSITLTGTTFGPDPCVGTYKYLEVEVECV